MDLCCGSGALGAALAALTGPIELHAVDIDPAAVQCARRNIRFGQGFLYEGDLFRPLPVQLHNRVQVIIANAPYVPTEHIPFMPAEARVHEARIALDGGADGLDVQRRIAAEAPLWLAQGAFCWWRLAGDRRRSRPSYLHNTDWSPDVGAEPCRIA